MKEQKHFGYFCNPYDLLNYYDNLEKLYKNIFDVENKIIGTELYEKKKRNCDKWH